MKKKPEGWGPMNGWEIRPLSPSQQFRESLFLNSDPNFGICSNTVFGDAMESKITESTRNNFTEMLPVTDVLFMSSPLPDFTTLPEVTTPYIPVELNIPITTPVPYILPTPMLNLNTTKGQILLTAINRELQKMGLPSDRDDIYFVDNTVFLNMVINATSRAAALGKENIPLYSFTHDDIASAFRMKKYRPVSDKTEMVIPIRQRKPMETFIPEPIYTQVNTELPISTPLESEISLIPPTPEPIIPEEPESKKLLYVGIGILALLILK